MRPTSDNAAPFFHLDELTNAVTPFERSPRHRPAHGGRWWRRLSYGTSIWGAHSRSGLDAGSVGAYRIVSGVDTGGVTSGDLSGFSA